jgi:putative membrane protein
MSSDRSDLATLVLLLLAATVALPLLAMGTGFGGTMGYGGRMGGRVVWWPLVGMVVPLAFLVLALVGGYLLVRRASDAGGANDPAVEELRRAYARGDLSDEEFERRRERLERSE